ncbi:hypothetical protein EDD15DRAFT_2557239 [Pisolithus albus]|nr:hypothetical protein EDD15DRAFT_2557239 [Pisolithus albus]
MNRPPRFARDDPDIPERLCNRIESWALQPPKSQFQQYGPLNAFLSIKFPPSDYLVKPQALLRAIYPGIPAENAHAGIPVRNVDEDGVAELVMEVEEGRVSLDSNNAVVVKAEKTYPDFVVTAYGDVARPHEDNDGDVIRLIIEVGSIKPSASEAKTKQEIQLQLYEYLKVTGGKGYRWKGDIIGIAILGTEFSILKPWKEDYTKSGKWYSLYSETFTNAIKRVVNI